MNEQLPVWAQWLALVVGTLATVFAAWAIWEAKGARREASATVARERRLDHQIDHLTELAEILATQGPSHSSWAARVQILMRAALLEPDELPTLRAVFDIEPPKSAQENMLAAVKQANPDHRATGVGGLGMDQRWQHFGLPGYQAELLAAIQRRVG